MHDERDVLEVVRRIEDKVDDLTKLMILMIRLEKEMTPQLQKVKDDVAALKGAVASVKALLDWLVGQIKNADSLEDIQAIGADVEASTQVLADAVAQNPLPVETPAA